MPRKTRNISFKGTTGLRVFRIISNLPVGTVSEFVVDAINEKILYEIEWLKERIKALQKKILDINETLKLGEILGKVPDAKTKKSFDNELEIYNTLLVKYKRCLRIYSDNL